MEQEQPVVEPENTPPENKESIPNENSQTVGENETPEQINWKKFREKREIERKERIAAEKKAAEKEAEAQALKAALEALVNKPAPYSSPEYLATEEPNEEEKIQKMIAQALEKQRKKDEEERQKREQQEFPQRIAATYPDFHQVCNADNVDYLEYHYPEVTEAFNYMPDGFDKWAKIYKAVKRLVPNVNSKKDQQKAEKNFSKPQSMSVAGRTTVGDTAPHQLDEKRRNDNWARMQRVMKGM